MNLTESQRAAVEHRGSNLLVAASAGSGKTEVLARRCVSLVADPKRPCGVDRLLVVTFTRAAAAELRVRVGRMLRERARETTDRALQRYLRQQELWVETADIGTIDAWCGRVVREHFAEAGIDVDFAVLSEQDALLLRRDVLSTLFDALHRGDGGDDPLVVAAREWMARAVEPGDAFLRNLVERLNRYRENLVNPEAWFTRRRESGGDPPAPILAAALTAECQFQESQLGEILRSGGAGGVLDLYREELGQWQRRLEVPDRIEEVVEDIAAFRIPKPSTRRGEAPELPIVGQVRKRWLEQRLQKVWSPDAIRIVLQYAPECATLTQTLLQLESRYEQMLAEAKRERAAYEFGDVLRMALDLLGTPNGDGGRIPTPIAERLRGRYEHILVDEYQDTSPVQVEILRLVTREGVGRTNRFMVGDVKQSIYGFRQAEPRLFTELIDDLEAGRQEGRVQYLSDNFRSHPGVLDPLSELFALLFDRELGGTAFKKSERLNAGREELQNPTLAGRPRVAVEVLEQGREGWTAREEDESVIEPERIEREAQLLAERILTLRAESIQVPTRDENGELVLRPMRWADCVVLLRAAALNAGRVAGVLRANGIPCVTGGRESLLDALEVADVCNVLRLLVNRRQDVPLAAYLRGPLVNLPETGLLEIRQAAGRQGDFHDAVEQYLAAGADVAVRESLATAMEQLDRWAVVAREEEVATLIRRILAEGGLIEFALALPGGVQRVGRLRALQRIAEEFNASGEGVAEFVAHLDALEAAAVDPGAPVAAGEDVVRILTIHAAKGLEFPFVFLLGAGARFNNQRQNEPLQTDEQLGIGLRFRDYPLRTDLTSAVHHVARRCVQERELGEELRLLYVAATRARECLFVLGHASEGAWQESQEQFGGTRQPLPLITRLSVASRLEWVLMAVAAGGLCEPRDGRPVAVQVNVHDAAALPLPATAHAAPAASTPAEWTSEDETWVARAKDLVQTRPDSALSRLPAVLSVSALKELAGAEHDADRPRTLDVPAATLRGPGFVDATGAADGRALGTACHRFLERVDFTRLQSAADVRQQLDEQKDAGWLDANEATCVPVDDLAWLAAAPVGTLLREHADSLRREMPFVYALPVGIDEEHTIVRGVIDCVIEAPDGLVLLDYKTDQVRDKATFEERCRMYTRQLQLYATAAAAILNRPVKQASLVFIRMRRVLDVPTDLPTPAELFR